MDKKVKKLTMNELRQTKDSYYVTPWFKNKDRDDIQKMRTEHWDWVKRMCEEMDIKIVLDLILEYPNDQELGEAIRKYYLDVKKNA